MFLSSEITGTASEYFERLDREVDWDETGKEGLVSMKEYDAIQEIIACQVSFFCLRRLRGSCQSNSDTMHTIMNRKIREYEATYGTFHNFNAEHII